MPSEIPEKVRDKNYRERVFEIVRQIPAGRVMTYGQIAAILGSDYTPRTVGYAMNQADESIPWQRVVNAQGGCSTGHIVLPSNLQQKLLEMEGVKFNERERCDLEVYRWQPEESEDLQAGKFSFDEQKSLFES